MPALKISTVKAVKRMAWAANIRCKKLLCLIAKVYSGVPSKMHQKEICKYVQNRI